MKILKTLALFNMLLLVPLGCAGGIVKTLSEVNSDRMLLDYALAENGATVVASTSTPEHPAETVINGITSSDEWNKGEGWEALFEREHLKRGWVRMEGRVRREEHGGAWITVHFPETKKINRVVVHTLNSNDYPASRHGIQSAALQIWLKDGWMAVGLVQNGNVEYPSHSLRYPAGDKIEFRFPFRETNKVRFVVFRSKDHLVVGKGQGTGTFATRSVAAVTERNAARIVEIEITGVEATDRIADAPAPSDDELFLDELLETKTVTANTEPAIAAKVDNTPEANTVSPTTEAESQETSTVEFASLEPSAQVEYVLRAYESAYRNRDLSGVMATISPHYSKGNEDYQQLMQKLESLFEKYTQLAFRLKRLHIEVALETATAESDYFVMLTSVAGTTTTHSDKLFFTLTQSDSGWLITRIDTQR